MANIQYGIQTDAAKATSTDDRTLSHMGGLSRQRSAMLASRETIFGHLARQMDTVADLKAELDTLHSYEEQYAVIAMRLHQARSLLAETVADLDNLDGRIKQYDEQLKSFVNLRETGEVVDKSALHGA